MLAWWRRAGLCVVGGAVGRHCWCELCRSQWGLRARSRRPGLEVPDPVGAESAPLEVMQAELMVQCWVTMAPLEVLQGHASAGARSQGELLVL